VLLRVDPHSGVPVFRQIVEQIRFHVASGLLAGGDEVPSTRALASDLGVNFMTVSKAYALLEEEGVLERRPGLPSVIAILDRKKAQTSRMDQLRGALQPAATAALQLGVNSKDAAALLRRLIDDPEG